VFAFVWCERILTSEGVEEGGVSEGKSKEKKTGWRKEG